MTSLDVTFDVPQWILDGLMNGSMERVGGVVRTTGGKEVVMWLRETGRVLQDDTPDVLSQLSSVVTNQNIMIGLQAANLVVSAAGFVVMYYKLDKIEKQLVGLDSKLSKLDRDLDWLDTKHLVSSLAPVVAAIRRTSSARRIGNSAVACQSFALAERDLGVADAYFREVLGRMLAHRFEIDRPEEFAACYRAWAMSAQGGAAVMAALGELPEALHRIREFKLEHAAFGKDYQARRSDPMARLQAGTDALVTDDTLNAVAREIASVHDIVRGQVLQLEFVESEKLDILEIDSGSSTAAAPYICYSVER